MYLGAPFYFQGDQDAACLLIHGFASTPSEVRWLGEQLSKRGYSTMGVLLSGHGTTPEELAGTTWKDWYSSVEGAYKRLRKDHKHVFVVGVSMGGLLAMMLAKNYPVEVAGIVTAGTPGSRWVFMDKRIHVTPIAKHFMPFQKRRVSPEARKLHEQTGRVYYFKRPLAAVQSMMQLTIRIRKLLPEILVPALIMHSRKDKVINPASADIIYKHLGSNQKTLFFVDESDHIITLDKERDLVLNCIDGFFRELLEERKS